MKQKLFEVLELYICYYNIKGELSREKKVVCPIEGVELARFALLCIKVY